MKKPLIMAAALMVSLPFAYSQDSNKVSIKPYGFIRNYYTFDSRQTYTVVGGEYNMIPYDIDTVDGVDLNDVPHGQLQALTSRFGLAITGPKVLGWNTGGRLEGDFGGFGTNNTVLRLRLAYLKLVRGGGEILVGQDWHPLSGDIMPEVLGMAAGAPFRPHSRTPQLRGTQYWGPLGYTAALLWQLQYTSVGPAGNTISYANNALWPEAFLGLNFRRGGWYAQMGVDAQVLRPRTHAVIGGITRKVDETVSSLTPTLYAQYAGKNLSVRFRTMLARNTSHLNQLVGYAVTGVNPDGSWEYRPISASISYLNIAYGRRYRANLFLGYMKNLGAGESLHDFGGGVYNIYIKGGNGFTHLGSVWRIAPSLSYNITAFNLGLEYELTSCTYGDIDTYGTVKPNHHLHLVTNHRLCAMVKYNF